MNFSRRISPVRALLLTVALAVLAALLPSAAAARGGEPRYPLPEPQTTKIEIPGSLGGIELGQTKDEVFEQWGDDAKCGKSFCRWGSNKTALNRGYANVSFEDGVVTAATIGWSPFFVDGKRPIRRSITKFTPPRASTSRALPRQ